MGGTSRQLQQRVWGLAEWASREDVRAWEARWYWRVKGQFFWPSLAFGFCGPGLRIMGNKGRCRLSPWRALCLREKRGPSLSGAPSLREKTQPLSWRLGTSIPGDRLRAGASAQLCQLTRPLGPGKRFCNCRKGRNLGSFCLSSLSVGTFPELVDLPPSCLCLSNAPRLSSRSPTTSALHCVKELLVPGPCCRGGH